MSHSFTHLLAHITFSTKDRQPLIDAELKPRLCGYAGGIVRETGGHALIVDGTLDHLHMLVTVPATLAMADLLRLTKTNTSRWIHEEFPERQMFAWQTGYAAFSVSQSSCAKVQRYIAGQEQHHRRQTFQEELVALLEKHGIEYDPRYLWE